MQRVRVPWRIRRLAALTFERIGGKTPARSVWNTFAREAWLMDEPDRSCPSPPAFSPVLCSRTPSASASRVARSRTQWLRWPSCGAQRESEITSKVARIFRRDRRNAARDFSHAVERRATQRRAAALGERIGRAHAASSDIRMKERRASDSDALDIGHRQREARTLQQRIHLAHIRERRDAGRDAALDFASASVNDWRSSASVSLLSIAARNRPSGLSARRT